MTTPAPLHAVSELENVEPRSWWGRAIRSLDRHLPILLWTEPPYGRRSVQSQLRQREQCPSVEWDGLGIAWVQVKRLLELIASEMKLPNPHFIPDDPLFLALTPEHNEDFPIASMRIAIQKAFGVDISRDDFLRMHHEGNWTVGRFAQFIQELVGPKQKRNRNIADFGTDK